MTIDRGISRVAVGLILIAALGHAASPAAGAPAPSDSLIVLRAAGYLDAARDTIFRPAVIVVRGDRIVSVGAQADPAARGARTIDLGAAILLPGLIDTHVHLTLGGPAAANAAATLDAGFTTVQDLGSLDYAAPRLRDSVATGLLPGPRIIASGPWLGATGGTCDFQGIGVRGADAFAKRVRDDAAKGADLIKLCVTGWPEDGYREPAKMEITDEELQATMAEARRLKLRVVAHAIGAAGVRRAVDAGVQAIVHSGYADDATLAVMRERGVWLIPTLRSFEVRPRTPALDSLSARMRQVLAGPVPIAFGTDAGVIPHGRNAREFGALVRHGMSPARALRAATVDAAAAIGLADRIGRLAAGMVADIIAVEGDPLVDVTALEHVRFVMQGGRVRRGGDAR
jgi:imidazolonepropionase-like amidohydrolase